MENLKEYMLIFSYNPSNEEPTEEQSQAMHKAWREFIGSVAMTGNLISTAQLDFNGKKLTSNHKVEEGMKISGNEIVGGNMVIKANSMESAIDVAKKCPILSMGGNVEVRAIIPMNH